MKVFGMVMIILSSVILAGQVSEYYNRRISYLHTLQGIITDIRARISYAPEDIFTICETYSSKRFRPFDELFRKCSESGDDLIDTMQNGFYEIKEMDHSAADAVISAFEGLLSSSWNGAVGHLGLCEERLKDISGKVEADCRAKGKMSEKLAIISGLFICILLA